MMNNQVYLIPVWETITSAWDKVHGTKRTFWASLLLFFVIMFGFGVLEGVTEGIPSIAWMIKVIAQVVAYLINLSVIYMGIRCAQDMPINYKMMFHAFNTTVASRLIGLYVLQTLLMLVPVIVAFAGYWCIFAGSALVFLLGILLLIASTICTAILVVRISISVAFVLDQNLGPWLSITKSIQATRGNFWNMVGLYLLQIVIFIASAIPLLLGLIWAIPFSLICFGLIYKRLCANVH